MSKAAKKTSPKTTSSKASKKAESAKAFAAALKEQNKGKEKAPAVKATAKPVEAPKTEKKATEVKKTSKAIAPNGLVKITEAVGVTWRAEAATAPQAGDALLLEIGEGKGQEQVVLIVSQTDECKDGTICVHSWTIKGSGDWLILQAHKGEMARMIWE